MVVQGSHLEQLGWVGDLDQAQSLAGVGILEGDEHQDLVLGPYQVVLAELVAHGRGVAEVEGLGAAD